jgi:hypothetical protein
MLWLAVVLGIALRAALCLWPGIPAMSADSYGYMAQAEAIRRGTWQDGFPSGYPLILAALPPYTAAPAVASAQLLNVVCGGLTVFASYRIARRVCRSEGAASAAALLVAVWPHQVNYARFVLTEAPVTAVMMTGMLAGVSTRPLLSAAVFGLAGTIRTTLLPVAMLAPFILAGRSTPRRLAGVFVAALVPIVAVAAAAASSGHAGLGSNLPNNIQTAVYSEGGLLRWADPAIPLGEAIDNYWSVMQADPAAFLRRRVAAALELWGPYPIEPARGPVARLIIGAHFPLLLLGLAGFWRLRSDARVWLLAVPVIAVSGVHVLLFATARFSVPLEPALIVLAVAGVDRLRATRACGSPVSGAPAASRGAAP